MATTEREIFDRLVTSFGAAATAAEQLSRFPKTGATYQRLRKHLVLIEGASRQAGFWRDDMRFQVIGVEVARCHQAAGDWLRGHAPRAHFKILAERLRALERAMVRLRTMPTGRSGAILPVPSPGPHRASRPVGWAPTKSGLLVPSAA